MRNKRNVSGLVIVALLVAGCSFSVGGGPDPGRVPSRIVAATAASLRAFDECGPVLRELQDVATRTAAAAGAGHVGSHERFAEDSSVSREAAAASPPSTMAMGQSEAGASGGGEWGGTNVQEVGVDEPDTVKTRDRVLTTVVGGTLRIVDLAGAQPRVVGEAAVGASAQLLVDGDTALVLTAGASGATTVLTAYDISYPTSPSVREAIELDGFLVSARMVDGMVRVVTSTGGPTLDFIEPSSTRAMETARRRNLEAIRTSSIDEWLPRFRVRDAAGRTTADRPMVGCADVYLTEEPASTSMVNVASVDLRAETLEATAGASVVGAGEIVYASARSLYVTSAALDVGDATDVHKFDIEGRSPATYRASGRVRGSVFDQFSLSERDGDLRIAVTTRAGLSDVPMAGAREPAVVAPPVTPSAQSSVVVLREGDGELVEVGRVDGLGPSEQIRSVRFLDDVGYVVTFRQTDPLYTIDLRDHAAPRVAGELKIPGYSSYLHPAGDGRLIGIGQDATEQGLVLGLQLALFDVSDPAAPQQVAKRVLPGASSTAEGEHHAFLWSAELGMAVVPVTEVGAAAWFDGAIGFSVADAGIEEQGRVSHPEGGRAFGAPIERIVVVDERLVALSANGLSTTAPATFAQLAWLPFE
jgi:uncharacterized secreted protein with C-terminal beta-propeller domain